jgi:threonyl-tRNA synthetase
MRLSELGSVYRYERLGVVHGLLRARGFTQDDSHIICREDQLVDEILGVFDLTLEILGTFGFVEPMITLSTLPGASIVTGEMAERATDALRTALEKTGWDYSVAEGEGSFYGPKVDFHFRDAIGRPWQLTTVQCDFGLPERFDMEYVGEDNQRHRPVMIHRAILGSVERFSGVLIEHYAGAFPLWLAPEQVRLVPVADRHVGYADELAGRFRAAGLRPEVDRSTETVGKKVRAAQLAKAPYVLVIGDREVESGVLTVRDRAGTESKGVALDDFVEALVEEASLRRLEQSAFGGD